MLSVAAAAAGDAVAAAAAVRLQAGYERQRGVQVKGALWDPVGTGVDLAGPGVNPEVETDPLPGDRCLQERPEMCYNSFYHRAAFPH